MGLPGRTSEAVEQLREAVRLDPSLSAAQRNLARVLALNPSTLPAAAAASALQSSQPDNAVAQ